MELTTAETKPVLSKFRKYKKLSLTLVGELLDVILSNDDEKILVEGDSRNFIYDTETGISVGKSLQTKICEVSVKQQESTIEITLSGTVETEQGLQQTCNLYFYMWWDHTQTSLLKHHSVQKLLPKGMYIQPTTLAEHLSDSVFELDLYRKKSFNQQEYLGQGRGYLVFGRSN
ncbi:MAG: hypothetical protein DSY80_08715 [Desulfocapsa sp.]|nr:MAG: hypothetical protein DSY80_08715 [Desulfocapsa sp.]